MLLADLEDRFCFGAAMLPSACSSEPFLRFLAEASLGSPVLNGIPALPASNRRLLGFERSFQNFENQQATSNAERSD